MPDYLGVAKVTKESIELELKNCSQMGAEEYIRQSPILIRNSSSYFINFENLMLPMRGIFKRAVYANTGKTGYVNSDHSARKLRSMGFDIVHVPATEISTSPKKNLADLGDREKNTQRVEKKQKYESVGWFRNHTAAREVKEIANYVCEACECNFEEKYGDIGVGYLEAHHIEPLALKKKDISKISADDLLALCANCHRMIHRLIADNGKPWRAVSLNELKSHIKEENS